MRFFAQKSPSLNMSSVMTTGVGMAGCNTFFQAKEDAFMNVV
jgi:hypothetical protein